MKTSETVAEIFTALTQAQSEMTGAKKEGDNPFFNSRYADLNSVIKAIKTPFANAGLSFVQAPINEGDKIGCQTRICHKSGEWVETEIVFNLQKLDPQAAGSAITYAKRYTLQSMAGVPSVDDDGEMAMVREPERISEEDAQAVIDRINKLGRSVDNFLKPYHVSSMFDLSVEQGENAKQRMDRVEKTEKENGEHDQAAESSGQGGQIPEGGQSEVLKQLRENIQSEEGAKK